jgi:hypothetical protein
MRVVLPCGVFEFAMILLLVGALVLIAGPMLMRRRGAGTDWVPGQLLVTGVSPPPADLTGPQYVTITGVINGPTVAEHVVYQRLAVDVNEWPTMSQIIPVVYSPKNPDNWRFAPQEMPPPPPPPQVY